MKLLLDTQILLWAAGQPERLSTAARELLEDPRSELIFSAASLWEVAIKNTLGREDFRVDPRVLRLVHASHGALAQQAPEEVRYDVRDPEGVRDPVGAEDAGERYLTGQA